MARLLLLVLAGLFAAACSDPETVQARPQLEVGEAEVGFGDVPVLNRATHSLEVRNVGRAPLTFGSVLVQEAGTPFTVVSAPETLEAGTVGVVELAFLPNRLASFAATLVLSSDDLDRPTVEVPLSGRGFTVAKMENDPVLDFGTVCEGAELVRSVKIRSTGTADLVLEGVGFGEGTDPAFQFVSSTRTPATVAKGTEITLTLRFSPSAKTPERPGGAIVLTGTDPERRTVSIALSARVNRAPRVSIAEVLTSAPGATVPLEGSATDPEQDLPLTWTWAMKSSPLGSRTQPSPLDQPRTSLALDLPGNYRLALTARDSVGCLSAPATVEVLAKPAQQLLVELVWSNLDADLDLHMVPEGSVFFGADDCFFQDAHLAPDWGVKGDSADDPRLERDALTGYGPEQIGYAKPAKGRYGVMVHYYNDHRARDPVTEATVRVYEFGVVKAERRQTLKTEGSRWMALWIDWPSGEVTPVDQVQ